jgi:hypothetical protein
MAPPLHDGDSLEREIAMSLNRNRAFFAVLALAGACSSQDLGPTMMPKPPVEGHAYLEIVGDKNVFLDTGARTTITVKYHDDAGDPVAGSVAFEVQGDAKGGSLTSASAVTDNQGLARVDVVGGANEAAFGVRASAQYATAVDWSIAVHIGPPPPGPLTLEGTYQVESQFDLVTGLPGTLGDVVRTVIDITDSTNDPTTFLIDAALSQIHDTAVTNAVNALRPGLDVGINEFLKSQLGDVYNNLLEFGNGFGDAAQRFGLKSELAVTKNADGSYAATHTVKGIFFFTDAGGGKRVRQDVDLADANVDYVVASNVPVTRNGDTSINIGDHSLQMSYGKLLVYSVRNVVLRLIDPGASTMTDFLQDTVDCAALGRKIYDDVGSGSAGIYESACKTALAFAGNLIEGKLTEVGGTATGFHLHGTVQIRDTDADRKIDKLVSGQWQGSLDIGPDSAALGQPSFLGTRMP